MIQMQAMCTIIAKNYLAFARTLVESFLSFHPDHKCYVLIVDDFEGLINPADECFEIIRLADLKIPNLSSFCFKYDVKELCTAVKARLLEHLIHEKSLDKLLYMDPDILVTGSLDSIYERLATYDIVLTPHLDADFPNDGLLPNESHVLRAGQFNLGFIGINSGENAMSFLNWWKPKLDEKCVVDLINGYFVDQKFIDFVPFFFRNVFVENDVGFNVAYWNLHSRQLSRDNGSWKSNDGPLYFFHFSGYDPNSTAVSSHIPNSLSRYRLSSRNVLGKLFAEYKELLIRNGYQQVISWPYTFGYFKSGEPIAYALRVYYRSVPPQWRSFGDPFDSQELKRTGLNIESANYTEQLNAIQNSRAWRWVRRYRRFNNRYLMPAHQFFVRLFRRHAVMPQSEKRQSPQYSDGLARDVVAATSESHIPSVQPVTVCFCTLAIHAPYRRRARLLCADATRVPWIVLTDEPDDFAALPIRAIHHAATGPMAADYLARLSPTGDGQGAAAYHDKRFAILAALQDFDTAIYVDADSRIAGLPPIGVFAPGLAVLPVVKKSIADHLQTCGPWRMPAFEELARHLTGDTDILRSARWCHETVVAVTKDGRESRFFDAWSLAAEFLQARGVYSGEGGVIGLAAACAGWSVDYEALSGIAASIQHEGGGPKEA